MFDCCDVEVSFKVWKEIKSCLTIVLFLVQAFLLDDSFVETTTRMVFLISELNKTGKSLSLICAEALPASPFIG